MPSVSPPEARAAGRAPAPLLALECAVSLLLVRVALKTLGFSRTVSLVRRLSEPGRAAAAPPEELVPGALRGVSMAGALFPGRARCLEQSLSLYRVLRRRGAAVHLRLGVQPRPFLAHAWVELDGRALGEEEEVIATLVPFPELG